MDVIKLKAFYTVAMLGSFSRAAEKLFFTQPAISSQIKELENEYNTTLFERIGRNIRLTEEGKALLPYAESILKSFEEAQFVVDSVGDKKLGSIKLGASALPGVNLMPEFVAEFRKLFPLINFQISVNYAYQIRKMVLNNDLDMGLVGSIEMGGQEEQLVEQTLLNDPIVVVVGREHSWSTRNEITLSELKEQPLILSFKSTITRQVIEKQFGKFDIPLKLAFEIGSTEVIKRMVELNLGISILSFSSVKKEIAAGWLKSLVISDLDLFRRINIIYHKEKLFSSALKLFIDFLLSKHSAVQL